MLVRNRHTMCRNSPAYTGIVCQSQTGLSHSLSFSLNYIFKFGWYNIIIYIRLLLAQCWSKTGTLCAGIHWHTPTWVCRSHTRLSDLLSFSLNYIFIFSWYIFTIYIQLLLSQCWSETGTLCAGIHRYTPARVCRSHTGLSNLLSFSLNYIFIFRWYLFTIYIQLLWAQCRSETGTLCARIHWHTPTLCAGHKLPSAICFHLA